MGKDHDTEMGGWERPVVGQEVGRLPSGLQAKQSL